VKVTIASAGIGLPAKLKQVSTTVVSTSMPAEVILAVEVRPRRA
jgi:hypothetical protein